MGVGGRGGGGGGRRLNAKGDKGHKFTCVTESRGFVASEKQALAVQL